MKSNQHKNNSSRRYTQSSSPYVQPGRPAQTNHKHKYNNKATSDSRANLKSSLKGKPTISGYNRSIMGGILDFGINILKVLFIVALCFMFMLGGFGGGMFLAYVEGRKALPSTELTQTETKSSCVFDIDGNLISKLGTDSNNQINIPLSDVKSTYIEKAVMSIEDQRFLTHQGIDLQRIGSAILSFLGNGGVATHGGSTITQQTIKLISGNDEHSTSRKVQEWFSAMELEKQLSKEEIMELYLNLAPMGNNLTGIQAAAQNYFGKDAKELTLAESAFLAGLPKSPSFYNPRRENGLRNAFRRMRVVLQKMNELGYITESEYQDARNTELIFKDPPVEEPTTINSYFFEYAIQEVISDLAKQKNISRSLATKFVYTRGYQIYTTMEPNVQNVMDEAFNNQSLFQKNPGELADKPEKPTGGMVIINVKTGAIAGIQGGFGEKTVNLGTNRATGIKRSPGSSIKPIIAYAPALELRKAYAGSIYDDSRCCLDPSRPNTPWPLNASRSYSGNVTVRHAIVHSINTTAVKVWKDVNADDPNTSLDFLSRMGIDRTEEGSYPAQAIGSFTEGVSPLEMCGAYNAIASVASYGGNSYIKPHAYSKVTDLDGATVIEPDLNPADVFSHSTGYIMSDIMKGVITEGTAVNHTNVITNSSGSKIATAGKTGTTDDNLDKWFCGYTPYYCAAVWYGYDNRLRQTTISRADQNNAMIIWQNIMQKIHADCDAKEDFLKPEGLDKAVVCSKSGMTPGNKCYNKGNVTKSDYVPEMPDSKFKCNKHD